MKKLIYIELVSLVGISSYLLLHWNEVPNNLTNMLSLLNLEIIYLLYSQIRQKDVLQE
jgi:hypothetical protein